MLSCNYYEFIFSYPLGPCSQISICPVLAIIMIVYPVLSTLATALIHSHCHAWLARSVHKTIK